jgi:aerobic carbon-monoxide dehydrogenase large subunit
LRGDGRKDQPVAHAARGILPGRRYRNGAHIAEVVIDPETVAAHVERFAPADDFGNHINPMLPEGQVLGGVVQGIGQALCEYVVFSPEKVRYSRHR